MSDLTQTLANETKIIKHYIKDLSFENLQSFKYQNFKKGELKLSDNISAVFENYGENTFGILLKYDCHCNLVKNKEKSFILEIDYFGLFIINNMENYSQDDLTKSGCIHLFPLLKNIVEYVTQNGSPITISLNNLDINQIKKTNF